jgi:hypothetical protein
MRGEGIFADHIAQIFSISCRRAGIEEEHFPKLSMLSALSATLYGTVTCGGG